jgi:hypothetical protein
MNNTNGPFGPSHNGTIYVFFVQRPNEAAGFAFMVLFILAALAHLFYLFRLRTWFFIPFVIGGLGTKSIFTRENLI